jgi:hypothetical protein
MMIRVFAIFVSIFGLGMLIELCTRNYWVQICLLDSIEIDSLQFYNTRRRTQQSTQIGYGSRSSTLTDRCTAIYSLH